VAALVDGGVLGVQPERVVAHRPQDVEALTAPDVREHVAQRVVEDVAHVKLARGVREHLEDVRRAPLVSGRGSGCRIRHREGALGRPHGLPLGLDGCRLVLLGVGLLHLLGLPSTCSLGTKKPLGREAQGESRGVAAFAPWTT
jgi:hypothetical protein